MMSISRKEITAFSKYILDISGIYLDERKGYLLETRLKGLIGECKAQSYGALLDHIKADTSKKLETKLVDAITTNETFFFRDNVPFDLLRNKITPDLIDLRRKQYPSGPIPIKVWSAACSTGQEVYSIAITLLEMLAGMGKFEISILGTDISGEAVAQASYGKYNRFEVERGLPQNIRNKYFTKSGDSWRIKDEVRSLARFEKMNLLRPFPAAVGPFDIVFCRNVAIYFQNHDKIKLFKKIAKTLSPGGSLLVGGSENLSGIAPDFVSRQYLRSIFYQLPSEAQPSRSHLVQETAAPPASVAVKRTVSKARRKTVYDRPRKAKVKKETPVSAKRIPEEKESIHHAETWSPVANEVPVDHTANTIKDQNQAPVPLVEKLASRRHNEMEKTSLLASLEVKGSNSSALIERNQGRSSSKQSLLEGISRQSKKTEEETQKN